jgi:hypothetical protein
MSRDRLRLDVAVTPASEIYSWAGAHEFETRDLTEIVGGGPVGTGSFGAFLMSIFGRHDATFTYLGETESGGRTLMEFEYRVARENSHYRIRTNDGWVIAGYSGHVLADPDTNDLVQLSIRTDALPPETGSCETRTRLDYQRIVVGDADLLLPRQTSQRFVLRNGIETENVSTFSACREYRGQSTMRFVEESGPDSSPADAAQQPLRPSDLPSGLAVTAEFTAPIDAWTASGGDTIPMRLSRPIVDSAKRVLVPAGAAIEARLIRVQRYFTGPERTTIVIKPEAIQRNGARLPFPVLPGLQPAAQAARSASPLRTPAAGEIPMPNETKFGVLHFNGGHVILPQGYRTHWVTAKP